MLIDDRLATVLRSVPRSETAVRTQFRQLVDLLGSNSETGQSEALAQAYLRLGELAGELPPQEQSAILRQPGLRLRNRQLAAWLAAREPQCAAAAMATTRLSESDWQQLIPELPLTARGFLRHRRDLPTGAKRLLDQLGVGDLVLPQPEKPATAAPADTVPAPVARPVAPQSRAIETPEGIGELVRRIEAFRSARHGPTGTSPQLPLEDVQHGLMPPLAFDFATDREGTFEWVDSPIAPLMIGMRLSGELAELDAASLRAIVLRQPIANGSLAIDASPPIAGEWRIDASPRFATGSGVFEGYLGRIQRRPAASQEAADAAPEHDRIRQLLHELRTPVNAIQGFAELIQQQLFGPAPNEYRALAAGVAVDAARLLAGFDEVDRIARLESGALALDPGHCDLREATGHILRRLEGALRPRNAMIDFSVSGANFEVPVARDDALQLTWRLLATVAGALAPGEAISVQMEDDGARVILRIELAASLAAREDIFTAGGAQQPRAISAGMFGAGFALRLARAEAETAGGALQRDENTLILALPSANAPEGGQRMAAPDKGNGTEGA